MTRFIAEENQVHRMPIGISVLMETAFNAWQALHLPDFIHFNFKAAKQLLVLPSILVPSLPLSLIDS